MAVQYGPPFYFKAFTHIRRAKTGVLDGANGVKIAEERARLTPIFCPIFAPKMANFMALFGFEWAKMAQNGPKLTSFHLSEHPKWYRPTFGPQTAPR